MTVKSMLMVCQGNICRSPMAEALFARNYSQRPNPVTVTSAGIGALVGESADKNAQEVMQRVGIDLSNHRARQIDDVIIRKAELIFVMTLRQQERLEKMFKLVKGKVYLLGYWRGFEIDDPYQKSREYFEEVYKKIELAWQDWAQRI